MTSFSVFSQEKSSVNVYSDSKEKPSSTVIQNPQGGTDVIINKGSNPSSNSSNSYNNVKMKEKKSSNPYDNVKMPPKKNTEVKMGKPSQVIRE